MNDPRVIAWQPGKFAAALQNASTSGKPVVFDVIIIMAILPRIKMLRIKILQTFLPLLYGKQVTRPFSRNNRLSNFL